MSLSAYRLAPAPISTALLASEAIDASASPTDTSPPPLLAEVAETFALAVPLTLMSLALSDDPAPTLTLTVGEILALTSAPTVRPRR